MDDAISFDRVAPVLPVLDLDVALERYRRLGFSVEPYEGGPRYGFVERDAVALHLIEWDEHDPKRTGAHIYLYVSDADALYAEWTAAGVEGRFGDPFDTAYGLREFSFVDSDGNMHRVGSPLGGAETS
jgi:hypothetical protein